MTDAEAEARRLRHAIAAAVSAIDCGNGHRVAGILRGALDGRFTVDEDWTLDAVGQPSQRYVGIWDRVTRVLTREGRGVIDATWARDQAAAIVSELAGLENFGPLDDRPGTDETPDPPKERFRQVVTARLAGNDDLARELIQVHPGRGYDLAWTASSLTKEIVEMWAKGAGQRARQLWADFCRFIESEEATRGR